MQSVLSGRTARRTELVSGEAHLMVRALPLVDGRERVGSIVLCRDVSDLRSKERELVTKDATIREIHHRVKNNLQTVAALLRMQARRIESPEARMALTDAMSRVASIAIVHETLSQAFDEIVEFDRVADGLLRMVGDVAASGAGYPRSGTAASVCCQQRSRRAWRWSSASCARTPSSTASPTIGRGSGGAEPAEGRLRVEISDNGRGLPAGFDWRRHAAWDCRS